MKFFCLYDVKLSEFLTPFAAPSKGVMLRSLTDAVNDSKRETDVAKYPGDFSVYYLGEFDNQSGSFQALSIPEKIVQCSELLNAQI